MTTTTTRTAPAPAHMVTVVSDGYEYRAECSCDWAGGWHDSPGAADTEGAEHGEGAIGPPDEMDLLMSALLDLQDDLAATVVWLAENWSAHLPLLGWYANGSDSDPDQPALRVIAACDPGELTAAAEVLGSALSDDPPKGNGSPRHRRAVRDVGRVRIEVFASLDRCERAESGQ